jgi:hypothetical protein
LGGRVVYQVLFRALIIIGTTQIGGICRGIQENPTFFENRAIG